MDIFDILDKFIRIVFEGKGQCDVELNELNLGFYSISLFYSFDEVHIKINYQDGSYLKYYAYMDGDTIKLY